MNRFYQFPCIDRILTRNEQASRKKEISHGTMDAAIYNYTIKGKEVLSVVVQYDGLIREAQFNLAYTRNIELLFNIPIKKLKDECLHQTQ